MKETAAIQTTYINPFTDFSFKRIFASEASKDLLKAFLNELLAGERYVESIDYSKNEYPGDIKDEGGIIVDVVCRDRYGNIFLVEVQRAKQAFFKERSLFYTSKLIVEQAPRGDRKKWAYNLKDVYLIAILEDFELGQDDDQNYLHNICLINKATGKIFYNKFGFTYIEMRNFVKGPAELQSKMDKWLYALKNMTSLTEKPSTMQGPEFDQLFELSRYANLTKEEKAMYDQSLKNKWDTYGAMEYAKSSGHQEGLQEGLQQGLQEGLKQGIEKGIEQGIEQGFENGRKEKAKEIAQALKTKDTDSHLISEITGLSLEEIEEL